MSQSQGRILSRKDGGIGWMTFSNPARRNAMSLEMWRELATVMTGFNEDPEIRVIVMTGDGDKSFVSGADISQFEKSRADAKAVAEYGRIMDEGRRHLRECQKPLIAMIRGYCIGGGLTIALTADFRIASQDAQFAIPAARLGLAYGFDAIKGLVGLVGPSWANEILCTARRLKADEAAAVGLINASVPAAELEAVVRERASSIIDNAPLTVLSARMCVRQACMDPSERDLAYLERLRQACFDSADYAEGRRAFMEKRKPVFLGK